MRLIWAYLLGGALVSAALYTWLPEGHADVFTQKTAFKTRPPYPFADYNLPRINAKQVRNTTGLPIVHLAINPDDLFSFFDGIYTDGWSALTDGQFKGRKFKWQRRANWNNRGKEWRRQGKISLYDTSGRLQITFDGKCAINGNYTRDFPQKSFKIKFKDKQAQNAELFKSLAIQKELVLRNTGNDWGIAFCRDHLARQAIQNQQITSQRSHPCIVYVNEVYWGIYYLSNKLDEDYVAALYDCKKKKVHIIENALLNHGTGTGLTYFREAVKQVQQIGASDSLPQNLYFDVNDLVTYLAVQVYFCNTDFPNNNVLCYAVEDPKTGETASYNNKTFSKIRFLFTDFDFAYGLNMQGRAFEYDMFAHIHQKRGVMSNVFSTLLKNKQFAALFKMRMNELLQTSLDAQRQLACFGTIYNQLAPNIGMQANRWRKPFSKNEWEDAMQAIKTFIGNRKQALYGQWRKQH